MTETGFHFAEPAWLLALLVLIPVALWLQFSTTLRSARGRIQRYADKHLLPHLTATRELSSLERWDRFARWGLLWVLAVLAMAGPRWDFTDVRLFRPGSDLVILLDISRSMEVGDVSPTRLARARQEIQDLVTQNRDVRIGLIAFATVAHVVSPITDDSQSILNTLPAISTDLARLQGSRLREALDRAIQLLAGQPEDSGHSILLISDGDFDEPGLEDKVRYLTSEGVHLHVLGIGTGDGGPVPAPTGDWLMERGRGRVISRLNESLLESLAEQGNGIYREANFRDGDTGDVLQLARELAPARAVEDEQTRVWRERFYWLLIPLLLLLLAPIRRLFKAEAGS